MSIVIRPSPPDDPRCPLEMLPAALPQAVDLLHQSVHLHRREGNDVTEQVKPGKNNSWCASFLM